MAATIYRTATEYAANAITITRGTVSDITSVGVYHSTDPNAVPTVAQFTTVALVTAGNPLADGTTTDVLSLIGTKAGAHLSLTAGDYQRFVLIRTATEDIIRKTDTLTVL